MNRIDRLFKEKTGGILSVYMTAGYPSLQDTSKILNALQEHGADMVEIGIPFSDPLADGPVIQESNKKALDNGMSLKLLFEQLKDIRDNVHIPLIMMGYLNPVLQMGMETFLERCRETGIDGIIIPDLPPDLFESRYCDLFRNFGIHNILLITPYTDPERIRQIADLSGGFLYMVADASTTGAKRTIEQHQHSYFDRIRSMNLPLPVLIGFGISSHETFITASQYSRGAIIGSAFIRSLGGEGDPDRIIKDFIRNIR